MEKPAQSKVPIEARSGPEIQPEWQNPLGTFHPQAEMYLPSENSTSQLGAVVGVQAYYCFPARLRQHCPGASQGVPPEVLPELTG